MDFLWARVFRVENGRLACTKTAGGVDWQLAVAARDARGELFASGVARRLGLRRCVLLGEAGRLELAEDEWAAFREELLTLQKHLPELEAAAKPRSRARGGRLEYSGSFAADLRRALDAVREAERRPGRGDVLSIVSD